MKRWFVQHRERDCVLLLRIVVKVLVTGWGSEGENAAQGCRATGAEKPCQSYWTGRQSILPTPVCTRRGVSRETSASAGPLAQGVNHHVDGQQKSLHLAVAKFEQDCERRCNRRPRAPMAHKLIR